MRRFYFLLFSLALLPCLAQAQTTAITLQVTDSGSQQWLNGTWSATLVSPPGSNPFGPPFFQLGTATTVPNQSQSGTLSGTGSATMTLSQNAFISPSGSGWSFNVCSLTTAINRCFTQIVTITSATTVTLTPPALIVNPGPTAQAYADAELQGAVVGSIYYNTSSNTQRVCNGPSPCVWGSSTAVNGAGTNPLGASFNIKAVSPPAIGDAKKTVTAVTTNASSTITDATNSPWLSTDVGKKIYCLGFNGNNALSTVISTISAFNSTSSISISPATGNNQSQNPSICVWFTQKETASFLAASTAAQQTLKAIRPFLGPTLDNPSNVYIPCGRYVVDGPFFVQNSASGNTLGAGVLGAGKSCVTIFISPDVAISNTSWMINTTQNTGMTFQGFTIDCSLANLSVAAPGMRFNTSQNFWLRDVEIDGCGTTGDNSGLIQIVNSINFIVDHLTINNAPTLVPTTEPPIVVSGSAFINFRELYTTNPGPVPMQFTTSGGQAFAGGPRSITGGGILVESSTIDEGGNPVSLQITNGSSVNMVGSSIFEGVAGGASVDGTSSFYITASHIAPFGGACSGGNRTALTLSSGANVVATEDTFESCGANGAGLSANVSGPAGATFVSAGGNEFRNCPGGPPCPKVTAANYATLGFNGGIIPKSSETHTPNTCYITGTFAATSAATPPCAMKADQNYQLIQIEAASTTTTACTVAPVITISDGVQTATLTLTTAKSIWDSSVDTSSGIGSVFATGNVITMSNTAGTCTTPPTNFNVTPILQSVLNP